MSSSAVLTYRDHDPVYASPGRTSTNTRLLTVATAELNRYLGGDGAFAHHFSRWPRHQSDDPMAYRWHCQHHNIVRLGTLTQVVRDMNPQQPKERPGANHQFASGRDRILAARRAAQHAQTLKALNEELASVEEHVAFIVVIGLWSFAIIMIASVLAASSQSWLQPKAPKKSTSHNLSSGTLAPL